MMFNYFYPRQRVLYAFLCFLFMVLGFSLNSMAQITVLQGVAPVDPPTGGFHIDGNLKANTPTTGVGDWLQGPSGTGGYVLDGTNSGTPLDNTTTFHLYDAFTTPDNNFSGGLKVDGNPNSWTWVSNPVNTKEDLNNGLLHFTRDPITGHQWVIIAADRESNKGDAYVDFEFLQKPLAITTTPGSDPPSGGFTSAGTQGGRTVNDFILTLKLTNGGSNAGFAVSVWQAVSGGSYDYVDATSSMPVNSVYAAVNTSAINDVSYLAFGGHSYATNTFVEGAIDLTALLGAVEDKCTQLNISTIMVKTKESQANTATIVDFIAPKQVALVIGDADAGPDQQSCAGTGGSTDFKLAGKATSAGGTVTSTTWSVVDGAATFDDEHDLNTTAHVTSSPATIRLTVVTNDNPNCTVTDDVVLTVEDVTVTADNQSVCAGGSVALTGSPAGGTWKDANDNVIANGIFDATGLSEGDYTVTYSYTNTNGCSGQKTATVHVNDLPTVSAKDNEVCAGSTVTLSGGSPDGGLWSGDNVDNGVFDATKLTKGSYPVTYAYTDATTSCSNTASANVIVNEAPTAIAGDPQSTCGGDAVTLNGTVGGGATGGTWSTSGTGTFDPDANTLTAKYTPSADDIAAGSVKLTLTSTGQASSCTAATSDVTITIKPVPSINVKSNCGSATLTASSTGTGTFTWTGPNGYTNSGSAITVTSGGTYTVAQNGCSTTTNVTIANCSHIFPTQTTCCNYLYGNTANFQFKQVCLTPTYSSKGNTVFNAIPGVFFYYGDFTPATLIPKGTLITVVVTQTRTNMTYLAPFSGKSLNYVRVTDDKCNNIGLNKSATYNSDGSVTIQFKSTGVAKYVVSVKYDTKSIIGTKLPAGKPIATNTVVSTYTFGMKVNGSSVAGSEGSIDAKVGCSDNTPAPDGVCPTTTLTMNTLGSNFDTIDELPNALSVAAYPNPYNSSIRFTVANPKAGQGSLEVYNLLGQKVSTVYHGFIPAGMQTYNLNLSPVHRTNLIYRLSVNGNQVTGKLLHAGE